jgi:3-deoxy-manno-octulosonate cytidylyltransferase (CMP-KDO synthetase)
VTFHVIIPARHASTRLPGKPLLDIGGKPMVQHVYERAQESAAASVVIATDSDLIRQAAVKFGARVQMTSPDHRSGTDRLAETVTRLGYADEEIVVNVQGDEPLMPPALMRQVADNLAANPGADMATLCTRIHAAHELFDPSVVKVVSDREGFALYFSRAVIPWDRDALAQAPGSLPPGVAHFRHLGIYAYRTGFLKRYVALEPCEMEQRESLEQLRVLWHGGRIHVAAAQALPGPGVDTPADLERVRAILAAR